ncbi:chromosome partitioning protein ParA, partial [Campylobacter jejuni]|nr:chromosome partitioning protein ParA [Campylobacter jejuni]
MEELMVISVVNEKGGSGKTTLATNLAFKFSSEKLDILLIDADPQRSIETFMDFRANNDLEFPFNSISRIGNSLSKEIKNFISKYDSIIIDTGGRDSSEMRQALLLSDLVLIPTIASGYDQAVLEKMINLVKEASIVNEKLKALIVINRASPNPFLEKKINNLKE